MGYGASGEDLVTLDTPRLILRQWQPTDLDRYAELFADPEVARYIFRGQPARREKLSEMAGDYLRQWRDLRLGPFAAIDKETGAWIGQIGLNHLAYWPGPEKVEVGWELHRRWWGRGPAFRVRGARAAADHQHGGTGQPRLPPRHGKARAHLPGNPRHRRHRDRLVRDRQHRLKPGPVSVQLPGCRSVTGLGPARSWSQSPQFGPPADAGQASEQRADALTGYPVRRRTI